MRLIGSGRRTRDLFSSFARSFARARRLEKVHTGLVFMEDSHRAGVLVLRIKEAVRTKQVDGVAGPHVEDLYRGLVVGSSWVSSSSWEVTFSSQRWPLPWRRPRNCSSLTVEQMRLRCAVL